MKRKIELLAPAQNKDCGILAIKCGADSVYIGANAFGARKKAGNSLEDIEEVINYAHKFGGKVYVTINTILDDSELKEAARLIEDLHRLKADGIIFQDMGILELASRGELADIKLIASTQCDNRDIDKVKFFENTGVERVILARELSLSQIEEICKNTNVEIETFIHGALCVSYSGQCYLSYKIGGRSANRGECAQACRKKYTLINEGGKVLAKEKYLLSLKDFMGANYLQKLILAGVTSFKIEGRLKDENYIKNTVLYYRKALDEAIKECPDTIKASCGKVFSDFETDLNKSFNRGFSEYFLSGERQEGKGLCNYDLPNGTGEYIGMVQKPYPERKTGYGKNCFLLKTRKGVEIHPQDGLCYVQNGELEGVLVNSTGETADGTIIFTNQNVKIPAGTKVYRNKDAGYESILRNLDIKRRILADFKIYDGEIECIDEDGNSVRTRFLKENKAKNIENTKESWIKGLKKAGNSDFYINDVSFSNIPDEKIYFLSMAEINALRRETLEKLMNLRLKNYMPAGQKKISPAIYPQNQGDYRLNVHNKEAQQFYEKCGCEVKEYSLETTKNTRKRELMRTKHCIRNMLNICLCKGGNKKENLFLIDEKGEKYELMFDCKECEMLIKSL